MIRKTRFSLFLSVLLGLGGLALAHSDATGVVKQRMELMKSIAEQMKTVGKMIKGESEFDADQVATAARTIVLHAEKIPDMFPEGPVEPPSEALPAIWQDWEAFLQLTSDMKVQAGDLSAVAENGADLNDIRLQFAAVGKTCSACHKDYRVKK